jgi:hypothetical protein
MPYYRLAMDDQSEILVEMNSTEKYRGPLSEGNVFPDLSGQFSKIMDLIKVTAQNAHKGYLSIPKAFRPTEFELVFGIKLNAEAGVVISKVGSESSFQATLRWK